MHLLKSTCIKWLVNNENNGGLRLRTINLFYPLLVSVREDRDDCSIGTHRGCDAPVQQYDDSTHVGICTDQELNIDYVILFIYCL